MNTKFLKSILLIATVILFASCDKDYNSVGTSIVGDDHFGQSSDKNTTVIAYTRKTGAVQTNDLAVTPFGVYDDPNFGKTIGSYATQLELSSVAPTIDPLLLQNVTSVVLNVPYFSTFISTDSNSDSTYELVKDSIIGSLTSKIDLGVYENHYSLNSFDPFNSEFQHFYSNQDADFDFQKGNKLNTSSDTAQNTQFVFSTSENRIPTTTYSTGVVTTVRSAPSMRLDLDKARFQSLLFTNATTANLASNTAFKNYCQGLYFKVNQVGTDKIMAMMNFRKGTITVKYTEKTSTTDATLIEKNIVMNLSGTSASMLTNSFGSSGTAYNALPNMGNTTAGDDKIYLKGGEGSVAIIELFGKDIEKYDSNLGIFTIGSNNIADELEHLRHPIDGKKWLINEANLTFYVDDATMSSSAKDPNRIFLYDVNNKRPVIDYYYDASTNSATNYSKYIHSGLIVKNASGRGTSYKVRITNYIRNLVNKDSTNVKLGLSVTQAITTQTFGRVNVSTASLTQVQKNAYYYPVASVINPFGTILWGNTASVAEDKKLKLEIWYTKPD
jgi:Domain of unknown function (DUF4270)